MNEQRSPFGREAKGVPTRWVPLFLIGIFLSLAIPPPAQAQSAFCTWEHPESLGEYEGYRAFEATAGPEHFPDTWSDWEADYPRLLWYWQRRLSGKEAYEDSLEALHAPYGLTGEEAALAQPPELLMGALSQTFLAREAALGTNPVPVIKRYLETGGYLRALR